MVNDIEGKLMPYRPNRPCPGRGLRRNACPSLIKGSEKLCSECMVYEKKANRKYDKERGNSGERGYDATEQKVRKMKANRDPLCEECLKSGIVKPLDKVHHIKPIKTHPELRLVMENLRSLCDSCHEDEHKGERWGYLKSSE